MLFGSRAQDDAVDRRGGAARSAHPPVRRAGDQRRPRARRWSGPWPEGTQVAVLRASGCFWGAEKEFWETPGVVTTAVGYKGGYTPNPTYEETCTGKTGHAETVLVAYDPAQVTDRGAAARTSGSRTTRPRAAAGQRRRHAVPLGVLLDDAGAEGRLRGHPRRLPGRADPAPVRRRSRPRSARPRTRASSTTPRTTTSSTCTRSRTATAASAAPASRARSAWARSWTADLRPERPGQQTRGGLSPAAPSTGRTGGRQGRHTPGSCPGSRIPQRP